MLPIESWRGCSFGWYSGEWTLIWKCSGMLRWGHGCGQSSASYCTCVWGGVVRGLHGLHGWGGGSGGGGGGGRRKSSAATCRDIGYVKSSTFGRSVVVWWRVGFVLCNEIGVRIFVDAGWCGRSGLFGIFAIPPLGFDKSTFRDWWISTAWGFLGRATGVGGSIDVVLTLPFFAGPLERGEEERHERLDGVHRVVF